jgi:RND family efflux transporter MFP subunit
MNRMLTVAVMALGTAACGTSHDEAPHQATTEHATVEARTQWVSSLVPVEGTVAARQRAEISTRLMARVTSVPVDIGSSVERGETLIRLGTEDVAANRAKADAAVRAAEAARDEAHRHAARMDTLLAADAVAQVQRDQAYLGLTQAESQLALAQATAAEVRTAEGYSTIVAPFDGMVVSRYVDPGDLANPGMPLMVVESGGAREAVLAVPPDLAAVLAAGDSLEVAGHDGRSTVAAIRTVAGGADQRSRTVEVRALLPTDWPTGVSLTGYVPAGTREAVVIPDSVIVRRGQLTGVMVVTDGRATLRWIRLGRAIPGGMVEVLSGLVEGDKVTS